MSQSATPEERADRATPEERADRATPEERVLLVDDNDVNLDILAAFIAHTGRETVLARSGEAAVALAAVEHFDLILMDLRMPEMDGYAASRLILALPPPHGQVRIVALTAYGSPGDLALCYEAGMHGHLTKPLSLETLAAALDRLIPPRHFVHPASVNAPSVSSACVERIETPEDKR